MWAADLAAQRPPPASPAAGVVEVRPPAAGVVEAMGDEGDLVATRLARGCRCFARCEGGALVAYGWVAAAPEWIGEIGCEIRPAPGEVYVWNCVTLDPHRRRGHFRALLRGIVAICRAEALARGWIGSVEPGAERALVDSGFVPVLKVESRAVARARMIRVQPVSGAPAGLVAEGRRALGLRRAAALRMAAIRRH